MRKALLPAVVLALVACSVTTPRDEALTVASGSGLAGTVDPSVVDPGSVGGDAGVGDPVTGGPTGGAATGGRTAGPTSGATSTVPRLDGPSASTAPASRRTSAVGVDDDSIVISVSLQFTGPLGQIYENFYSTAMVTWAEDVNERGGIHGRRIELRKVDNRGTVDGQVAACREIQGNGSFVAIVEGGSISDAEADCLDDVGFPAMSAFAAARVPKWTAVRAVVSAQAARAMGTFVRGPLGGAGKKVGVITVENFLAYKDAALEGARDAGLEVVRVEIAQTNQASFVSELLRLRDAGAEVVMIITGTEAIGILRDARAIGYRPIWAGIPWAGDELSLAAGDLMQGVRALRFWTAADSPAAEEYQRLVAKHGNGTPTSASMAMYGTAVSLGRALELAGPGLDREALAAGFDRMEAFDAGVIPPVTFAGGRVIGTNAQFPVSCCNERREWVGIGPSAEEF